MTPSLQYLVGTDSARLGARHQVSGLNSRFAAGHLPFADYVAHQSELIAHVRYALSKVSNVGALEQIVAGNAPFELKPAATAQRTRRGVLLIHGLTDSPYFMRRLGAFFHAQGFHVMAILLPGHGTQPGDLLEVSHREWAHAVAYGVEQLATVTDEIYLAGYSAGATLSIAHSLRDRRVRGLFLYSPALQINARAAWARLHQTYSWLLPAARWVNILPDVDVYKYESMPKNAAAQMYALTREVHQALQQRALDIPVFAVASADDVTAMPSATVDFMARLRHPWRKLVLYTTDMDCLVPGLARHHLERVYSRIPASGILSSAHTAIVLPPDDAHYGAQGGYHNCTHYHPHDMQKYAVCMNHPGQIFQGEVNAANLQSGILRRLMVNPHFAQMEDSMYRFIAELP